MLPISSSFVGCKTTNASILFRAAEYVQSLNKSINKCDSELNKLQTQYSALEMILKQYENFSLDVHSYSIIQIRLVCISKKII